MNRPTLRSVRAFTLIELLTVVAIIGVLSAILLVTLGKARSMAERTSTIASLRSVGLAIAAYVNDDRQGRLPGNLNIGQMPGYSTNNRRYLGYFLWPYLSDPEPTATTYVSPALKNRAYERQRVSEGMGIDTFVYMVCTQIGSSAKGNLLANPFGNGSEENKPPYPISFVKLAEYSPSKEWAIRDVDRKIRSGSNYLPEPPLGNVRMHLYFDWHVAPVKVE
ncbi:N-terminal cleavage protein [Opitutaceae bacterium TAV5]|nr:N-terminal cleavage protein [Opitutaceae bacterium TAV5]